MRYQNVPEANKLSPEDELQIYIEMNPDLNDQAIAYLKFLNKSTHFYSTNLDVYIVNISSPEYQLLVNVFAFLAQRGVKISPAFFDQLTSKKDIQEIFKFLSDKKVAIDAVFMNAFTSNSALRDALYFLSKQDISIDSDLLSTLISNNSLLELLHTLNVNNLSINTDQLLKISKNQGMIDALKEKFRTSEINQNAFDRFEMKPSAPEVTNVPSNASEINTIPISDAALAQLGSAPSSNNALSGSQQTSQNLSNSETVHSTVVELYSTAVPNRKITEQPVLKTPQTHSSKTALLMGVGMIFAGFAIIALSIAAIIATHGGALGIGVVHAALLGGSYDITKSLWIAAGAVIAMNGARLIRDNYKGLFAEKNANGASCDKSAVLQLTGK